MFYTFFIQWVIYWIRSASYVLQDKTSTSYLNQTSFTNLKQLKFYGVYEISATKEDKWYCYVYLTYIIDEIKRKYMNELKDR